MIQLLTPKTTYTIDYPQAIEYATTQAHIFWTPDEIDVEKDLQDIKVNFTPAEYHGVVSTLKLFTLYELSVGNDYWSGYISQIFQRPDIQRMANCLSSDTRFITTEGLKSFNDFNDGDYTYVLTHTGSYKRAIVRCYGESSLNKIILKRGVGKGTKKVVYATNNHRWKLVDRDTTNLRIGDVLLQAPDILSKWDFWAASEEEKLQWCYGFAYGDGNSYDNGSGKKYGRIRLCGNKSKYADRFTECGFKVTKPTCLKGDLKVTLNEEYKKVLPDLDAKINHKLCFCVGLCDADAGKNSKNSLYSSIQMSGKDINTFIRNTFQSCGIYIGNIRDYTGQITNYGVRKNETKWYCLHTNQDKYKWKVESIEKEVKTENVWCLEVEDDHSFILDGGIVTGNCFSFFEINVHAPFYNKINEVLGLDTDDFYREYLNDPILKNRMGWISKRVSKRESDYDRLKSIAIFSMIEGAILYSSFAFLKHFQAEGKNKLVNVTAGINFSVKDENIHSEAGAWLFRTYLGEVQKHKDYGQYFFLNKRADLFSEIYETAHIIYEHECAIINKIFEHGEIKGITSYNLKEFVKHRLNLCLKQLGLREIFTVSDNYIESWFYKNINSAKLHDFFVKQGSEYNRNWDESKFIWKV